jgi:hypothetical protein
MKTVKNTIKATIQERNVQHQVTGKLLYCVQLRSQMKCRLLEESY